MPSTYHVDNGSVPQYWTAARIANHVHRAVLGPLGFTRQGKMCQRSDGGLRRTLTFRTSTGGANPKVEMLVEVAVAGLPGPATKHRHDSLWGAVRTAAGHRWYALPESDQALPLELLADASGPMLEFLLRAAERDDFVLWAQEVFLGDSQPGWWGRFQPVFPQGTGTLQAAAFAAATMADFAMVEFLAARVENEEASELYFDDFLTELRQLQPRLEPRHLIQRPIGS